MLDANSTLSEPMHALVGRVFYRGLPRGNDILLTTHGPNVFMLSRWDEVIASIKENMPWPAS